MYKQNPKSPLMKAMIGDLNKDGKMSGYETARQNAIEKSMAKSPAKQTTAGEFAYEKHRKDMEMGKATYPSDKARAALTALTSDSVTYSEAKKQLRKKRKAEYENKNKNKK